MMETMNTSPHITHCEVTERAADRWTSGGFNVSPVWANADGERPLDRPIVGGYLVRDKRMADRLVRAIMAGVVYHDAEVRTDINGATYVNAPSRVLGRMMNADLRRLGF